MRSRAVRRLRVAAARLRHRAGRWLARVVNVGVDASTPAHLVDRVVFCNWACLVGTLSNLLGAQANVAHEYPLLLALNVWYETAIVAAWLLNRAHRYLAARLTILGALYAGMTFACAVQGPAVEMEHFFLAFAVIAFALFHPSERRWSILFGVAAAALFLYFVGRATPLLDIDPSRGRYTVADLRTNQVSYLLLLVLSLVGLSSSHARAIRLLDEQRAQLFEQRRLASVGAMAAHIAHEVNSPLAALDIRLYGLATALKRLDPAVAAEPLRAVEHLGRLSARIASLVREYQRISSSDSEAPSTFTLESLVRPVLDLNEDRVRRLGVDLVLRLEDRQATLSGPAVALSQAVASLVDNAFDAVAALPREQRWIHVETEADDERCRITIADSGTIAPDVRERLFEPFFTTKPVARGVGLGLAVSRQTLERQGGSLRLDDRRATTAFVVELPRRAPPATDGA